ncbi:MAG: thioredoxin family protein [Bacteroidetes bacterium HGW-Bacteroidetes-1]|nr:MAG: thioredoxin family protein [Bacteroidetes bacterium HGW-Bacteroidetes-1]
MKQMIFFIALFGVALIGNAQGYKVGDKAIDFQLLNVDGTMVSLADFSEAKGFIVMFTCNACPYSVAYEDRKIELDNKYAQLGYPVIAINPNDSTVQPKDSYSEMIIRAKEKLFPYPYLLDADQTIFKAYGATRTPHVFILNKEGEDLIVRYIGAIDNNHEDATQASEKYVEDAIEALLAGRLPKVDFTKAIGCTIKVKK